MASFAPYEFVEILTNTRTYGGGGIFGLYGTVAADSLWAPYVFVHEFGHHFAALADEYYTSRRRLRAGGRAGVEPWEPNVTALLDPAKLKWKDLVDAGHAAADAVGEGGVREALARDPGASAGRSAPRTGPRRRWTRSSRRQQATRRSSSATEQHAGKVGAFEGAMYEAKGYYRPQVDCIMFTPRRGAVLRGVPAGASSGSSTSTRGNGSHMSFRRGVALSGFARRHLGRMAAGRRGVMAHLSAPSAENLPMPTFVQLRVTNLCNLRCKMCGQWGDTGIFRSQSGEDPTDGALERQRIVELIGAKRQLALADYVRLLDEIAEWNPIVSLFGGEPFLYPDILPLIAEIKRRGLTCTVITNGGRLEALAKDLVELGIDSIAVSIDGPPDVHDRIRGRVRQLCEGRGGDSRRGALAERAVAPAADGDGHPPGDGAQPRRDRPGGRGSAPASARHDQRGPALVRPGKRGRRIRAGHARGPRGDGDLLEGLRLRLGLRLRDARRRS